MEISPYSSDQRRIMNTVRRQSPPASGPRSAWNRPRFWFRFIIAIFVCNLFIAFVTIERHISNVSKIPKTSSSVSDRPITLSSRWRQEQPKAQFSTESRIWRRMLLQQQGQEIDRANSYFLCKNNTQQTAAMMASEVNHRDIVHNSKGVTGLPPFGFPDAVQSYVHKHERGGKEAASSSSSSSSSSSIYCLAPPSKPACESFQYTVVIYFGRSHQDDDEVYREFNSSAGLKIRRPKRGHIYWRNVVVGTMKYLAYPSVQRVNLVLREKESHDTIDPVSSANISADSRPRTNALEDCAKRDKYAKRVLNWSRDGVVNVVSTASLWDAIDRLEVPSDSTLWIDGDFHPDHSRTGSNSNKTDNNAVAATGTMLKQRFHTWRETPNALVIPKVNNIVPAPLFERNDRHEDETAHSVCSLPLLHGMMMHTNYLCYLNHPVVGSELRNYSDSFRRRMGSNDGIPKSDRYEDLSWEVTTIAIGMLLFSVGEGYVIEDHRFYDGDYRSSFPLPAAASGNKAFAASAEEISKYLGCQCSMASPRLFPSNTQKCASDQAIR